MALTSDDIKRIEQIIEPVCVQVKDLKDTTDRILKKVDNGTFVRKELHEECMGSHRERIDKLEKSDKNQNGLLVKILLALVASGVIGAGTGVGIQQLLP